MRRGGNPLPPGAGTWTPPGIERVSEEAMMHR